jgi:hypothetical protein
MNIAALIPILTWVFLLGALVRTPSHLKGPLWAAAAYVLVVTGCLGFAWVIFWTSAVAVSPEGMRVRNILYVHTIPWECIDEIVVRSGLEIRLKPTGTIDSIQYGSAPLGDLTGYPTYWTAVEKIRAYRRTSAVTGATGAKVRTEFSFPYRTFLAWLAFSSLLVILGW